MQLIFTHIIFHKAWLMKCYHTINETLRLVIIYVLYQGIVTEVCLFENCFIRKYFQLRIYKPTYSVILNWPTSEKQVIELFCFLNRIIPAFVFSKILWNSPKYYQQTVIFNRFIKLIKAFLGFYYKRTKKINKIQISILYKVRLKIIITDESVTPTAREDRLTLRLLRIAALTSFLS